MTETAENCVLVGVRHPDFAEGVRGLLGSIFETVVMVADDASLVAAACRLQPRLAVVDLSLSRGKKLHWVQRLRDACPRVKLIALSVHDEGSVREAVLAAGADAFVLKRAVATDLLPAVETVLAGGQFASQGKPPA